MIIQGIYKIECNINNKIYIGSSNNIQCRWSSHVENLLKNRHHNIYLQNDFNKYGISNFSFQILEIAYNLNKIKLLNLETKYILNYNCLDKDIGYNISLPTMQAKTSKRIKKVNFNIKNIDKNILKQNLNIISILDMKKFDNYKFDYLQKSECFSHSWYIKNNSNCNLVRLMLLNFFRKYMKAKTKDIYWTCFIDTKDKIKGKGYTKGYINMIIANEIKDKRNILAYCCNTYQNPFSIIDNSKALKEENYSLNSILKWIISVSDIHKPIYIFIPSLRMVNILKSYLNS